MAAVGASGSSRILFPVPGLTIPCPWQVGPVRFLPSGAARALAGVSPCLNVPLGQQAFQTYLDDRLSVLDEFAVAELTAAGDQAGQLATVADAVAVLRLVQHMRHRMNDMRHQAFGLPGQVTSAVLDYVIVGNSLTVGAARQGALAGLEFTAQDHQAWEAELPFRFLDEALATPEHDRTSFQARVLLAVRLLSQGWLSYQPEIELLSVAIALEALLGERADQDKKFRIARRVSYFSCGWPGELYPGTARVPCALMSLPLDGRRSGAPGPALRGVLDDMRAGRSMRCSTFLDVLDIYDLRNQIVHEGYLPSEVSRPSTWFVASQLLGEVLAWFAAHPDAELGDLDAEIAEMAATRAAGQQVHPAP